MEGWIKLYRQFINWEWYQDSKTKSLFIHLLLLANHEENKWQGNTIKRGQLITSLSHLAKDTGMTVQNVRTSLKKLKSTQEITYTSTSKYTLVSIVNYDKFQSEEIKLTNNLTQSLTINQQTTNKQLTTNKNDKNIILSYFINIYRDKNPSNFFERMSFLREIQTDEKYIELSPDEESELRTYVLGRRD